jgi:O-methyltransferase involved in polyketide biosynthesis
MEARRPDTVLDDPLAVDLLDAVDEPFEMPAGPAAEHAARHVEQERALRAKCLDQAVRAFCAAHPGGTVVALGEGLETRFWRVDDGRVRWIDVDTPAVVDLRRRLLPEHPRVRLIPLSPRGPGWLAGIDADARRRGVLVVAERLPSDPRRARDLVALCAANLPGGRLAFGTSSRDPAPRALPQGVTRVTDLSLPPGRGLFFGHLAPGLAHVPLVRARRPAVTVLGFGGRTDPAARR